MWIPLLYRFKGKKQITLGRPDLQTGSNDFTMFSLPLSHTKLHTCTHSHTYILPHKQKFVDIHTSSLPHTYTQTHTHKKPKPSRPCSYVQALTPIHISTHFSALQWHSHFCTYTQSTKCKLRMITAEDRSDLSMLSLLGFIMERNSSICSRPTVFRSSEYNYMNSHSLKSD